MYLISNVEFRGSDEKIIQDKHYKYINLEDEKGEASKFSTTDDVDFKLFKKGDKVKATFEYSPKYGSLKVIKLEKGA